MAAQISRMLFPCLNQYTMPEYALPCNVCQIASAPSSTLGYEHTPELLIGEHPQQLSVVASQLFSLAGIPSESAHPYMADLVVELSGAPILPSSTLTQSATVYPLPLAGMSTASNTCAAAPSVFTTCIMYARSDSAMSRWSGTVGPLLL